MNPKMKYMLDIFHNYCGYMHCTQYITNQSLQSADIRAIIIRPIAGVCLPMVL